MLAWLFPTRIRAAATTDVIPALLFGINRGTMQFPSAEVKRKHAASHICPL